jgi:CheY-like chemotaxis protein
VTKRLFLVHWNTAEAEERAGRLRDAGHAVECHADPASPARLGALRQDPPDAFVIDLGRLPSHGRAVAVWIRQQKATRHVPIVFVGDDPDRLKTARQVLPDALFTPWGRIRSAVRRAIREPPADPLVPGTMDGYASTPLPKKLGIRDGSLVALLGAPRRFEEALGSLPPGVRLKRRAQGRADLVLLFAHSLADLERRFPAASRTLTQGGGLWIAWPKRASGVRTDLSQAEVRAWGLGAGLVDYKICSIDETWSGLLFTRKRPPRDPDER